MLHISFLSEWYLLWRSINSRHNLYKWSVSSFLPYVHFFRIDILIFESWSKGTEQKKIYHPRIEPVTRQNKFESGPFGALSTCSNEAISY